VGNGSTLYESFLPLCNYLIEDGLNNITGTAVLFYPEVSITYNLITNKTFSFEHYNPKLKCVNVERYGKFCKRKEKYINVGCT
jgi:hypothetical protein